MAHRIVSPAEARSSTVSISQVSTKRKSQGREHGPASQSSMITAQNATTTGGAAPRIFQRSDLEAFNLLTNHPVWVFDVERRAMWWANDAAVNLWSAPTLESLLARDFGSDMSESTNQRLQEMMIKFRRGERSTDQVGYNYNNNNNSDEQDACCVHSLHFMCAHHKILFSFKPTQLSGPITPMGRVLSRLMWICQGSA